MGYYFGKGTDGFSPVTRTPGGRGRGGGGGDRTDAGEEDRRVRLPRDPTPEDPYFTPTPDPTAETGAETECAGGYALSSNPIAPGGGSLWTDDILQAQHGWYRDPDAAGHWIWHRDWGYQQLANVYDYVQGKGTLTANQGGACAKGYQPKDINGETWCCPEAGGGAGAGTDDLGWYEFPPEMQDYYSNLMGRGQEYLGKELGEWQVPPETQRFYDALMGRGQKFLDMPLGFTPGMINKWFGRDFDVIRGMERPLREQAMTTLGREGTLGTGAVPEQMGKIAWDVESKIGDLSRDLFIQSELQKKKDLVDYTGMAQGLFGQGFDFNKAIEAMNAARRGEEREYARMGQDVFGQGLGYNQLIEAINAARRGERQEAMNALMAFLGMMAWR